MPLNSLQQNLTLMAFVYEASRKRGNQNPVWNIDLCRLLAPGNVDNGFLYPQTVVFSRFASMRKSVPHTVTRLRTVLQTSCFRERDRLEPLGLGNRFIENFRFFRNFISLTYVQSFRQRVKKTILDSVNSEFNAFYAIALFAVYSHKMAG